MAVAKYRLPRAEPGTPLRHYYIADTFTDLPSSGLVVGEMAFCIDTNIRYVATSTTVWLNITGGGGGLVLGELSTEAYRGDRGKTAYDHSQVAHAPSDAVAQAATYTDNEITALIGGAPAAGDTLNDLYNLIIGAAQETSFANIAARNAHNVLSLPFHAFVIDDGDGNWALYKATTTGVGATFIKLSDPDLLNAVMSNSAIKTAYEANADTNAFTDALESKLNAIAAGAQVNADITKAEIEAKLIGEINSHTHLLPNSSAFATAETTISAATYADITGCSVSLAAGTWLIFGHVVGRAANAIIQMFVAITHSDNTVIAESAMSRPASGTASLNSPVSCSWFGIVTPGSTTTYKLRGARGTTTHTGSWIAMDGNGVNTANHVSNNSDKGTSIIALRIR